MPETLKIEGSKHGKQESWRERYSLEARKGRRRKTGNGVMALLSRMHRLGLHGRHDNTSKAPHPSIPGKPTAELPAVNANRALPSTEAVPAVPNPNFVGPQNIPEYTPGRISIETALARQAAALTGTQEQPTVPEASKIRPEIPPTELASDIEDEYVGRHRRPETLADTDALLRAREAAQALVLPAEQAPEPQTDAEQIAAAFNGDTFYSSDGAEMPKGFTARTPGEHYDPANDVANMSQRQVDVQGIVTHDNSVRVPPKVAQETPKATEDWFGGANSHR